VVDDFGVKYVKKEDMDHLVTTIGNRYAVKVDWKAEYYLGITTKWDYVNRTATSSMPGYVKEALLEFQHTSTNVVNRIPAIRVSAVRVTPIFTNKKHALNS
jgi:hypothetical protein